MDYTKFDPDELILRDHLALDRTILANERTLLAYLRTALFLVVSGVSLVKLFPDSAALVGLGYAAIVTAIMVGALGVWRFRVMHKRIEAARRPKKASQ